MNDAPRIDWHEDLRQPGREKVRALLLDDDDVDIAMFSRLSDRSRHIEFDLVACRTIPEARAELEKRRFDVVFVDYWLGMETSIAFVHEFARAHDVPAILLTGLDEPEIRRVAFRAGVEAFLAKDELSTQALESVTLAVLRHHAKL